MSQVLKGYALDKQDERTQDQAVLEIAQGLLEPLELDACS